MNFRASSETIPRGSAIALRATWITLFVILTGLSAFLRIPLPFTPVPITLQTAVVMTSGIVLGRDGILAQGIYLILGGIGLPLFAGSSSSFADLFGPTGGYLFGFVLAAAVTSAWIRPHWHSFSVFGRGWRVLLASLFIFLPGVIQLKFFLDISISKALALGFYPFILGDVVKSAVVAFLPSKLLR